MTAEWLRISRRWDVWLVATLVIGGAAWLYLSAFRDSTGIMGIENPGSWGSGEGPPPEPRFLDAMLSLRGPYAFPGSLLTVLDSAWLLPPLGAYLAAVTIGPDFWWGTMRSILVTRRSRAALLAQRMAIISIFVLGCLLVILAAAPIAQLTLLALAGERFPAGSLQADTFVRMIGVGLIAALGHSLIAATVTLLARSLVGGIVLLGAFAAGELAVSAAATSFGAPLVRELTFSGALNSIVQQLRPPPVELIFDYSVGGLVPAINQPPPAVHLLSVEAGFVVAVSWLLAAAGLAFYRIQTMDILE